MLKTRTSCRVCGSSSLVPVLSLGNQYLASNFQTSDDFPMVDRALPLELVRCNAEQDEDACGAAQLRHTVPPDLMYASYGYRSGINQTMQRHLAALVATVCERRDVADGDIVVDIGANDGTTLRSYPQGGLAKIAFEPSDVAPEDSDVRVIRDYFSADAFYREMPNQRAKVITSIAMFYDLEDPGSFVRDIAEILHPDGLWVAEFAYLPLVLQHNLFDTICHEHLVYYSLSSFEWLLKQNGLKLLDAETNLINGGTLRIYAAPRSSGQIDVPARRRLYNLRRREMELALERSEPYGAFADRIEGIRRELTDLLVDLRSRGKRVMGYGASTKGNVILQYCEINPHLVEKIADRNPAKWGSETIGTGIPIVSEDEVRSDSPDYLLVLPWHFLDEFVERESKFLESGGAFIVPLPDVRIVDKASLAAE